MKLSIMVQPLKQWFNNKLKLVLIICLIVILSIAAQVLNVQGLLQTSLLWLNSMGSLEPIAFIAIYNLATILFIPGSILTLGGGVLFGMFWGSVYVFIAATLGSIFAFLIGRYLSRSWVSTQIEGNAKFKAIDQAVAREGLKIVLLTRLSPLFPFNLLNYAFGVTQVSLQDYVLGSVGMLPGTIMYVYIGSLAGSLAMICSGNQPTSPEALIAQWVIRVIGLIATVAVTIYVTRVAKKALETKL